jgi:tRNA(fMet)-specific endonuclease VapC
MPAVLLDTNVYSYVANKHSIGRLYEKHLKGKQQALCFVVVAELLAGAEHRAWGPAKRGDLETNIKLHTVIPYDIGVCRVWASLRRVKNVDGSVRTVPDNDCWIAACAIHHNIPLVSHNRKHFQGLPGLQLLCEAPPLP